jgi:uncharacterized membrane protein YoaK (UPF0700 family)
MSSAARHRQIIDASLLSFIAGFVDTCVFVGLFGLFTAHVTGNLALIGTEIVHREGRDVIPKLLSLPVFVLAVVVAVKASDYLKRRGQHRIAPLLCAEAVLLVLTIVAAVAFGPLVRAEDPIPITVGMLAAAAMGLQNALMRLELTSLPSTTVMTTNVTQAVIDAVIVVTASSDTPADTRHLEDSRHRFERMWPPIVTFALGAIGGAAGYAWAHFTSLLLPALLCLLVAYRFSRR